ncbi:Protein bli-3 [Tolypocladium capitatum]|uniref:Protein bli-3 n=1 Tax=Tolypocladium capitatum TaxID=45235 RepID=A0A2K3Q9G6_9HYPO|nr:Protein bli-3 [Tolypocladium capitatum]
MLMGVDSGEMEYVSGRYKSNCTKPWPYPLWHYTLHGECQETIPNLPLFYTYTVPPGSMSFSNTSVGDKPTDPYKKANEDDPKLETKVHDLIEFMTACRLGMMTTHEAATSNLVSRCMALAATEAGGIDLLFHTNTESGKTNDVSNDPNINISFVNVSGEWASISGTATIETARDLIKAHYNPLLKAWLGDLGDGKHDGSENDPRIGMIRVKMNSATYSPVAKNVLSRTAEVVRGAITGQPAQVDRLREISPSDVKEWRDAHTIT